MKLKEGGRGHHIRGLVNGGEVSCDIIVNCVVRSIEIPRPLWLKSHYVNLLCPCSDQKPQTRPAAVVVAAHTSPASFGYTMSGIFEYPKSKQTFVQSSNIHLVNYTM